MHSDAFDRYHHHDSALHRLDPRIKVVVVIAFILSNALLPDGAWTAFGLAWLFLFLANALSDLGLGYTFKRSFIALPFALVAVTVLFSIPGKPLSQFHFMMWEFTVTDAGLLRFVSIVIRSWLSVQAAILLVAVTRFPDLIHAFEHLRVPAILTTIIAFLYRYLFVLMDEVMRLLRARQSRSAAATGQRSGGGVLWRARVSGHMAGQLFLRSYERSDRIYNAMLARGYVGQLLTLNPHELHGRDWAYAAVAFLFILAMQFVGRF
ncbi:MAG: cobalt ECF transporter T component CbiQ [Anaerolineales bacterium]|nr:cobalt ECF transporter T component CbiQ [Anaerolineales bacterium]